MYSRRIKHGLSDDKFTLEPLRKAGQKSLVCADVPGIDWIKLVEISYQWYGVFGGTIVHRASDLFKSLERRGNVQPMKAVIVSSQFRVKFTDSCSIRRIRLRPSRLLGCDSLHEKRLLLNWLEKRGFARTKLEYNAGLASS